MPPKQVNREDIHGKKGTTSVGMVTRDESRPNATADPPMTDRESELELVTEELTAERAEYASIGAQVKGLEARRAVAGASPGQTPLLSLPPT
jgi:hypothetical protein